MRARVAAPSLAVVAFAFALATTAASAHDVEDPRVLVVVPGPERLEIRLNDVEPAGARATELRTRFDEDDDGTLRDDERANLEAFLATRATRNLKVTQGGKPLPLETVSRSFRGADGGLRGSESLSVDVVLAARPAGDRVEVRIADARPDGHGVRVAVAGEGVRVVSASQGKLDPKRPVVTGISLDREHALVLVYERE